METTALIIYLLWIPQAVAQFLLWLSWHQVKEYRFDRFKSFITSSEGKKKLKIHFIAIKLLALTLAALFNDVILIVILLLVFFNLYYFNEAIRRKIRRPVFTQRVKRMLLVGIASLALVLLFLQFLPISHSLIVGELLLLISPAAGVLITIPVVNRIKKKEIDTASKRLKKVNPIVIGITGSYGKTTTKDFLMTILSKKYKVLKTKKNENTVFGVARRIINDLPDETEVFIAEMGAYKKGEIRKLAEMTQPKIGMITGIEPQHLDLFGSLENIKKAKFELIESLPKDGSAVFNLSNEDTRGLYRKAKKGHMSLKVFGYVLHKNIGKRYEEIIPDFESHIIESNEKGVKFEVFESGKRHNLFAPVTGIHFIENITGAILVARHMDVGWNQIKIAVRKLKLPERTMEVSQLDYGSLLIDDSYNSTPRGFLSALNYLSYFKNKNRVVITPGIIELGERSRGIHKKLGNAIANKSDYAIITNSEPAKYIKEGFSKSNQHIDLIENDEKLISAVEQLIESGTVILLEGRISSKAYNYIMNRKK